MTTIGRIQAGSGLIFALFLLPHLITTISGLAGIAAYDGTLSLLRNLYRPHLVVEIPLIAVSGTVHIGCAIAQMAKRRKLVAVRGPWWLRAHRLSGYFLESVTFAFLLAIEALTPLQRATLLLRDAFDYSVRETAQATGLSEANVRTTHHRARRAMTAYDIDRRLPDGALSERTRASLMSFVMAVERRDIQALEQLLAPSARVVSDAGGEFTSARKPVVGRSEVVRFFLGLADKMPSGGRFELRTLNGLPALVAELPLVHQRWAHRWVSRCDLDSSGLIADLHSVLATRKLTAVPFPRLG